MVEQMTQSSRHWDDVYIRKSVESVSWFRAHLDSSLALLKNAGLGGDSRIIDVGGGASTLVDDLLDLAVAEVTVLDISANALDVSRARLGLRADRVHWLATDVTSADLRQGHYTHWHDRAAFHFFHEEEMLAAYVRQAAKAVAPGGYAVIGGFAPDGPERCSGLPVARRSAEDVEALLRPWFRLLASTRESHLTPGGSAQSFIYATLQREHL